jgi:hypothetical protein
MRTLASHGATALAFLGALALHASFARGQANDPPPATAASASAAPSASVAAPWQTSDAGDTREGLDPFPSTGRYLSYGFAFHSEGLLAPGNVCPEAASEQCILGTGGGISFSGALRVPAYSLGVTYEASFHDSHNIYQRGVLQQLRGEWRLRRLGFDITETIHPFVGAGGGVAGYGDNWAIATLGGSGHAMLGAEWDIGVKVSVNFALAYRAIYFRAFDDPTPQHRPAGLVHLLGLQLGLELHEPL